MYGKTARTALRKVVDESVDLIRSPAGKALKPGERNKLVDRIIFELWMRGFAFSARTPGLRPGFQRDEHDAWRTRKLKPHPSLNQTDVEAIGAEKPSGPPSGHQSTPAA